MTHQLARAVVLVLGVLIAGLSASPAAAVGHHAPASADVTRPDGVIVKRTSQALCCQARPPGLDHPLQLATPTRAATAPRPPARVALPIPSDLAPPAGLHAVCADSRAPPRLL